MSKTENQQDLPKKSSPEHEMGNCYNERKVFARNLCPSRLATTRFLPLGGNRNLSSHVHFGGLSGLLLPRAIHDGTRS